MPNKKVYYWLFILCACIKLNSQSFYKEYLTLIDNINLSDDTSLNLKKLQNLEDKVNIILMTCESEQLYNQQADVASKFGLTYYLYTYDYDSAITYGNIAIKIYEDKLNLLDKKYTNGLYNLGKFYLDNNELSKANVCFKKVVDLNNDNLKTGQAYCGIATTLNIAGDLYNSIDYYKKGLAFLEENLTYFIHESLPLIHLYEKIETPRSLDAKLKLLKNIEENANYEKLSLYHFLALNSEIASYYNNQRTFNFEKSKHYYFKNLKRVLAEKEDFYLGQIYTSIGNLYTNASKDSAVYYLNKGLEYTDDKSLIAINHNLTSKYYLLNNDFKKAEKSINLSLNASLNIQDIDKSVLTDINLYDQTIKKESTISALIKKSEVLIQQYLNNKSSTTYINEALFYLNKAEELVSKINKIDFEEGSQSHWQEEATKIYSNIIICYHYLNRPKQVFNYIEKGKTYLLNQAISTNLSQYKLPQKLSVKLYELKSNILTLKHKLKTEKNPQLINLYQDSLFNQKNNYRVYNDSLRSVFPKYKVVEKLVQSEKISHIQKTLDKNSVVLAYSWADQNLLLNKVTISAVTKDSTMSVIIDDIEKLENLISEFKILTSNPLNTKSELSKFKKIAHSLYQQLFPTKLNSFIFEKNIIIIPDGDLQNMPFEALVTNENSLSFLIEKYMISYAFSMTSLLNNNSVERSTTENLIGFSPVSFTDKNLSKLEYTKEETTSIGEIFSGTIFTNDSATKFNFLTKSNNAKIIHLATHANASSDPWIAFKDEKLQLHELYTYKNQADLVVLSACNTSSGKIVKGEGVMSLARGFFYSGTNSVVSTLWNINDKSSSTIMSDFYKNLKKRKSKSKALHEAKLNYLNTHTLSEKSPYYWSSFILIGNTSTLQLKQNHTTLLISVSIVIIIVIMIYRVFFHKK